MAAGKPIPEDQEYVRKCIRVGQLATVILLPLAIYIMPESNIQLTTAFDRIVFTLRWETFSAIVFMGSIISVADGRFNSAAINPLSGNDHILDIKIRNLQNTFEQFVLGFVGRIILCTYLDTTTQKVIPVLVLYFILSRGIFYYGYTRSPLQRAVGMSMTVTSQLFVYGAILFFFVKSGPLYGLK